MEAFLAWLYHWGPTIIGVPAVWWLVREGLTLNRMEQIAQRAERRTDNG